MHYIRNVVVEQIVLENLKEVIRYVSDYEDEFVQMVMDTDMRQRNKELSQKKKRLTEIHSRIQELDKIFQRIYEDNISGKLSDERFMKLSKGYEEEQHTLQKEQTSLEKELQKEEKQSVDTDHGTMRVQNEIDRFHLVKDVLLHLPQLGNRGAYLIQQMNDKLVAHKNYIHEIGQDMPEILDWKWHLPENK